MTLETATGKAETLVKGVVSIGCYLFPFTLL